MVQVGYLMAAIAKPLLAVAPAWGFVAALRATDRVGKAIRGVPRDLMIAEAVPKEQRGRNFGFHRAMDSAGAVVGPLVAIIALAIVGEHHLRPLFLLTLVPALATGPLLLRLPKTSDRPTGSAWEPGPLPWRGPFGWFVAVTVLFSLGNSSDAFLLLRAKNLGLSAIEVIVAYMLYNLIYASASLPAGIRSDRVGRERVFGAGLVVFAVVYAGFALSGSAAPVWLLFPLYGLYMAFTDGITKAIVVDLVPEGIRGKALGVVQALTGVCVLVAGIGAGFLWQEISPRAPFLVGAGTALAAVAVLTIGRVRGVFTPARVD
jgi:MFS family permease